MTTALPASRPESSPTPSNTPTAPRLRARAARRGECEESAPFPRQLVSRPTARIRPAGFADSRGQRAFSLARARNRFRLAGRYRRYCNGPLTSVWVSVKPQRSGSYISSALAGGAVTVRRRARAPRTATYSCLAPPSPQNKGTGPGGSRGNRPATNLHSPLTERSALGS